MSVIKIRTSTNKETPVDTGANNILVRGELAYSFFNNTDKLYIGDENGTDYHTIGGKYYVDLVESYETERSSLTDDVLPIWDDAGGQFVDSIISQNAGGTAITIAGNLTVTGTTTSINSNEVNIGDSILLLNSDETGTPSQNAGIEIERGTSANVQFIWDEGADRWYADNNLRVNGDLTANNDITASGDVYSGRYYYSGSATGTPIAGDDGGIIVQRGTETDTSIIWVEEFDRWEVDGDFLINDTFIAGGDLAMNGFSLIFDADGSAVTLTWDDTDRLVLSGPTGVATNLRVDGNIFADSYYGNLDSEAETASAATHYVTFTDVYNNPGERNVDTTLTYVPNTGLFSSDLIRSADGLAGAITLDSANDRIEFGRSPFVTGYITYNSNFKFSQDVIIDTATANTWTYFSSSKKLLSLAAPTYSAEANGIESGYFLTWISDGSGWVPNKTNTIDGGTF